MEVSQIVEEVNNYIAEYRAIQLSILNYLDEENNNDKTFQNVQKALDDIKQGNNYDIKRIFNLLQIIICNHHRNEYFFTKINKIINYIKEDIKQAYSSEDLFDLFFKNNRILALLIENELIKVNESNIEFLKSQSNKQYFSAEIYSFHGKNPSQYDSKNRAKYEIYKQKETLVKMTNNWQQ